MMSVLPGEDREVVQGVQLEQLLFPIKRYLIKQTGKIHNVQKQASSGF